MIRQSVKLISSRYKDDQRILESNWTRGTPDLTQQKLTSLDEYLYPKYLRYQLIPTTDIGDHRILQSDKMRGTTGHTQ